MTSTIDTIDVIIVKTITKCMQEVSKEYFAADEDKYLVMNALLRAQKLLIKEHNAEKELK